jgi:hypothetical protein
MEIPVIINGVGAEHAVTRRQKSYANSNYRINTLSERSLIDVQSFDDMVKSVTVNPCRLHPSLHFINPTGLTEPHAFQQLVECTILPTCENVGSVEPWLNGKHVNSDFDTPGYVMFRRDRTKRKGGGICIYL